MENQKSSGCCKCLLLLLVLATLLVVCVALLLSHAKLKTLEHKLEHMEEVTGRCFRNMSLKEKEDPAIVDIEKSLKLWKQDIIKLENMMKKNNETIIIMSNHITKHFNQISRRISELELKGILCKYTSKNTFSIFQDNKILYQNYLMKARKYLSLLWVSKKYSQ